MKTKFHLSALVLSILFTISYYGKTKASSQVIPFRLAGKLIIVQAKVDGQSGNFILDTGIPKLILNTRYYTGKPTDKVLLGLNGQEEKVSVTYPRVEIQGQTWKRVEAEVISMVPLEDAKGIAIHGLLGSDLFRKFILMIDYQKLEIEIFPINCKRGSTAFDSLHPPAVVLPFRFKGGSPLITAQIGQEEVQLAVDTGAEMNLIEDTYKAHLTADCDHLSDENIGGFGKGGKKVAAVPVPDIRVGVFTCQPMKTAFINMERLNQLIYGPKMDGIIGYEFLSQFRVAINFKKREVYMWNQTKGSRRRSFGRI